MKTFIEYYKTLELNNRINLKGSGAMLNPYFNGVNCPYLGDIKSLQSLEMDFARVLTNSPCWTNSGKRVFFTFDFNNPFRGVFDKLNSTCKNHYKRTHSMYPANSFDYLGLGSCNR